MQAFFLVKNRSIISLLSILFAAGIVAAAAQVVPSATGGRQISVTIGGLGSVFQPDYPAVQNGVVVDGVPGTSPNRLYGAGVYVDGKLTRWIQVEGEARWLRYNQFYDVHQTNYLIGPRVQLYRLHFWRATPYVKVLVGEGRMSFLGYEAYGHFTDIAYGAGLDFKMTHRLTVRLPDFEYQQWPKWINSPIPPHPNQQLFPYGVSVGVGYRFFGR